MSRPFSYNDENFTVIGNMLFIHICNKYLAFPGKILANVPLAIRNRVYHYESYLLVPVTMQYGYLTPRDGVPDIPELEKGGTLVLRHVFTQRHLRSLLFMVYCIRN